MPFCITSIIIIFIIKSTLTFLSPFSPMSEFHLDIPGLDFILQSPGSLSLSSSASNDENNFPSPGSLSFTPSASTDDIISPSCVNNEHSASPNLNEEVPSSVRNAPKELRRTIRRKQNKESARRARERRYAQMDFLQKKHDNNHERIRQLEIVMDQLLSAVGIAHNGLKGEQINDTGNQEGKPLVSMHGNDLPWDSFLWGSYMSTNNTSMSCMKSWIESYGVSAVLLVKRWELSCWDASDLGLWAFVHEHCGNLIPIQTLKSANQQVLPRWLVAYHIHVSADSVIFILSVT